MDPARRQRMLDELAAAKSRSRISKAKAEGVPAPDFEQLTGVPRELRGESIGLADPESWSSWLADKIAGGLSYGAPDATDRRIAAALTGTTVPGTGIDEGRGIGALDFVPFAGETLSAEDARQAYKKGDVLGTVLGAAGAVVPAVGKLAKKGGKTIAEAFAEETKAAREARAAGKGASQFDLLAPSEKFKKATATAEAKKEAATAAEAESYTPAGKPEAITAVSLRGKPLAEAVDIAKSERHIIPNKRGFVGAPVAAQSPADIEQLRANFDRDVGLGGGGADWYKRAQDWIKSVAGPDPARQHELSQNLALFSAQRDPNVNLGLSIAARNQSMMDMPLTVGGTEQQKVAYQKGLATGEIPLGAKTGIYAQHLDPTMSSPTTGTNDIWHARALGYTEPELQGGLSPQQHSWMDAETVLAMDRANRAKIAGRTDWTPGEVQAAPWVAGKARGLEERMGWSPEKSMAEATKTYPDYADRYTAYGTHEMATGKQIGHLPGVNLDEEPGSWWQGPGGRDILYDAQGAYVGPTAATTGVFQQGPGDYVFNSMQSAKPLVSMVGDTGRKTIDPASRQMMTGTEAFRAMMDAQDAGAWSFTVPDQRLSHANAFATELPASRETLADLLATAKGVNPNFDVLPQPNERALVTDFGADPGISSAQKKEVQAALPGASPVRREGDLINYGQSEDPTVNPWRGGAAEGQPPIEGSDQVTRMMLSKLNPAQEALLSKPEVRASVLAKFDRDQMVAARTGAPVRKDLQTARQIFAKDGIAGLRDALGKGLLPAVAVGAFLPYAMDSGDATGGGT